MLTCYPTPFKRKAWHICSAFAEGGGGRLSERMDLTGTTCAMFFGVVEATKPLWMEARRQGVDWIYGDNAYLDATREQYFRLTKNRLQHSGIGESDCKRFDGHHIPIKPWRKSGKHILICPQSDQFMKEVVEYPGSWLKDTVDRLRELTDRPIRIRPWTGNKRTWYQSLPEDLDDCWALVTWSSASATTAILQGIPAIVMAEDCIAHHMAGRIEQIENPPMPDNRREFAGLCADAQWNLEEMKSGYAWEQVRAQAATRRPESDYEYVG